MAKILIGLHSQQDRKNPSAHYIVGTYLDLLENDKTLRETALLENSSVHNPEEVIKAYVTGEGSIIGEYDETPEGKEIKTERLRIYHPPKERVGKEEINMTICGWHVDYKTNKRFGKPELVVVIAARDSRGRLNFINAHKQTFSPKSAKNLEDLMAQQFKTATEGFPVGHTISVEILPLGKDRAKFSVKGVLAPPTKPNSLMEQLAQL